MISLPFSKRTLGRLAVLATFALLAGSLAVGSARAEEWTKSYSVSGRARVHVDSNDGSVRVTTGDSAQVEFRVIYESYELNKNLRIDSRQDGDSVQLNARVTGHWGFSWGGGRRGPLDVPLLVLLPLRQDVVGEPPDHHQGWNEGRGHAADYLRSRQPHLEVSGQPHPHRLGVGPAGRRLFALQTWTRHHRTWRISLVALRVRCLSCGLQQPC